MNRIIILKQCIIEKKYRCIVFERRGRRPTCFGGRRVPAAGQKLNDSHSPPNSARDTRDFRKTLEKKNEQKINTQKIKED